MPIYIHVLTKMKEKKVYAMYAHAIDMLVIDRYRIRCGDCNIMYNVTLAKVIYRIHTKETQGIR